MIDLRELLSNAVKQEASDIHIKAGRVPHLRIEGDLEPQDNLPEVTREDTLELGRQLLNNRQREILAQKSEIDVSFGVENLGRFRLAVFQQRGAISLVLRLIPEKIPTIEGLHLPPVLREIAEAPRGLILVTGVSGSGKSTTLASILRHVNESFPYHVLTIEDPIEFLFQDQKCLISQREIAADTHDFAAALRAALRQDPDVILVGEMRDLETVGIAMQAAETGHLVMSTLHTTDTTDTVNRIISMFPMSQQHDVRLRFASTLRAVISMRLIKSSVSGGRVPAVEVLRNTELIYSLITAPERVREIRRALETGHKQYGMQTFDQSILQLCEDGLITEKDALDNASSPEDLKLKLEGIVSSSEAI